MPYWIRKNGGDWNLNPAANPVTGVGGYSFAGMRGSVCFINGHGADTTIAVNFGQSAFSFAVPAGFTAGWPAVGGGWSSFDPAKNVGFVVLSNGNRTFNNNTFNSFEQSVDGYTEGSFYFEFQPSGFTFFTTGAGTGVGREYPGITVASWQSGAGYGTGNVHGGIGLFGGNQLLGQHAVIYDQQTAVNPDFGLLDTSVYSVAVTLEPAQAEPTGVQASAQVGTPTLYIRNPSRFVMTELDLVERLGSQIDDNRSVTLRYSDDAGANWSEPINQTLGDIGEYKTNVQWRRLGMARSRVIELSWSCMFQTALTGAMITFEIAKT